MGVRAFSYPMWKSKKAIDARVKRTFRVQMRENGRTWRVRVAAGVLEVSFGSRGESSMSSTLASSSSYIDSLEYEELRKKHLEKRVAIERPISRPLSRLSFLVSSVSKATIKISRASHTHTKALRRLGAAYGNSCIHLTPVLPPNFESFPNHSGYSPTGSANAPPKMGPKMLATLNARGRIRKALLCHGFGTLSASIVRAAPTVPLTAPAKHLQTTAA